MIPNITRGGSTVKLLRYLAGRGRRDEHEHPHLVAGQPGTLLVEHGERVLAPRDVGPIASLLDEPMRDFGTEVTIAIKDADGQSTGERRAAHVWHCSLALHPTEPNLGDETWRRIAERYVSMLGFDPLDGRPACRWVAVHHGRSAGDSDHIHVVVNLVRDDGKVASVHMDRPRAQRACRTLEQEFGLNQVEACGRGAGERGVKPAEVIACQVDGSRSGVERIPTEHTARRQLERIVRACATAAVDERDFVGHLMAEGVLWRPRYEKGGRDDVVGYSVALEPEQGGQTIWYGGGRLSRELTLPRLRAAWPELDANARVAAWIRSSVGDRSRRTSTPPTPELQAECASQLAQLRERLRTVSHADQSTWALVARDAAGILAAWSLRTEPVPGPLAETGRAIARTAQLRAAQVPGTPRRPFPPTQTTARLLLRSATGPASNGLLFSRVRSLGDAIRDMHAAAGEAERAAELERTAIAQLRTISTTSTRHRPVGLEPGTPLRGRPDRSQRRRQRPVRDIER
ncbi:relaxase/mobilization nuclease domain-containing protein [Conexibacter sp. DBS9H8]|uniref:relaxase/mobilization nuclease domain-containing protein n=1 Tax=Conexibacter sp. DBS9H8 TaxID=2937801 RepID=UPI00200BCD7B|nr:hypothetical protein [Conexibacter sp. DBS9H8]